MKFLIAAAVVVAIVSLGRSQTGSAAAVPEQQKVPSTERPPDQLTEEKEADIRRLIELSGVVNVDEAANAVFEQLRPFMEQMDPERNERLKQFEKQFFEKILSEFSSRSVELTNSLVPVYSELFSAEEVKGLVQFYESPVGQRYVLVGPKLSARSVSLGQQIMLEILPDVMEELAEDFPEVMHQHVR